MQKIRLFDHSNASFIHLRMNAFSLENVYELHLNAHLQSSYERHELHQTRGYFF